MVLIRLPTDIEVLDIIRMCYSEEEKQCSTVVYNNLSLYH